MRSTGRINRALPQRVVQAALEILGYEQRANICVVRHRHRSHVDLRAWLTDLRAVPGRAPDPADGQRLWDFYHAEFVRTDRFSRRTLQEKLRRWNLHLRATGEPAARCGEPAPPVAPVADDTVDPYIRFFAPVYWDDHAEALHLFGRLTAHVRGCKNWREARVLRSYVRPVFYLLLALQDPGRRAVMPALAVCTRAQCVHALSTMTRERGRAIKAVYRITHGPWGVFFPAAWAAWTARPITKHEVRYRPPRRLRDRDRFTEEEIQRLRELAAQHPVDHALFTFFLPTLPPRGWVLAHTGCRSGAACSLRVDNVATLNPALAMRAVGRVEEKGGQCREFAIDAVLGPALEAAIRHNRGSAYVFPALQGVGRRSPGMNDQWFRGLCARAGIRGDHVHVHAIRRVSG